MHTQLTSLHHLCIQGGHSQLSHPFLGLLLLKSNEKVREASSALYHRTPIQIVAKPTEALDTALSVYL